MEKYTKFEDAILNISLFLYTHKLKNLGLTMRAWVVKKHQKPLEGIRIRYASREEILGKSIK